MSNVTQEMLTRLFRIDLDAGKLSWREPPSNHARLLGMEAGSPRSNRRGKHYWYVKIGRKAYKRSHIIFFLGYGYWPAPTVDHKDGDSLNDSIWNLRQATATENAWNHKKRARRISLPMGVRHTASGRFQARIAYHGRQIHLGAFDTAEEASAVYQSKRKELYRDFA